MELATNELKYLKSFDAITDIIKNTKSFLKDQKCTIIEPPSGFSNIHIRDGYIYLNLEDFKYFILNSRINSNQNKTWEEFII